MKLTEKIEAKRRAKEKAKRVETARNVGAGIVIGTVTGALGGVLLAPKRGKETRGDIKEVSKKATECVIEKANGARAIIGEKIVLSQETLVDSKTKLKEYIETKKEKNKKENTVVEVLDVKEEV